MTDLAQPHHRLVTVPTIGDERGMLLFAESTAQVPFDIKRLFVLYALPSDAQRGHHAHRVQHQFLMMLAGRCSVVIDNGALRAAVTLDRPSQGLYVPPMLWLELNGFSDDAVCAVLTSGTYDEGDYVRNRAEFDALTARS